MAPTAPTAPLTAEDFAALLQEPKVHVLARMLKHLGSARCEAMLEQALAVEAQGGLRRGDGQRRTPGGTFLHLLRQSCTPEERRRVWYIPRSQRHAKPPP